MKKALVIILSILSFASCNKINNIYNTRQNFPNKVGYQWTYRLINSNIDSIDTVEVEIVGQGTLPNGDSANIWKYTYKYSFMTYIDSVWVSSINNDVRFYDSDNPCSTCPNQMPFERLRYVLPLSVGKSWYTTAPYGDTTKVLDQENVSVPMGTFTNVFRLSKFRGPVTNSWTTDTIYFKEHIGLVKFRQAEYSLGPVIGNGIWELIGYNFGQ